jgi:molecular chaperone DnaK (HSP70)
MGRNKKQAKRKNAPGAGGTAPAAESSTSTNRTTGEKKESKFFVGLDFGTTYLALPVIHGSSTNTTSFTSVAFAHSESPNDIKLVDTWPAAATGSNSAEQVPTKVEYTKPEMTWGYEVQDGAINRGSKPLEWFKLLLQGRDASLPVSQNNSSHAGGQATAVSEVNELLDGLKISPWETPEEETPEKKTKKILDDLNITTVTLIADFLRKIKETALAAIKRTYWMQSEKGAKIEWILTVPAIWKDAAKNSMIQAARQAGFGERGVDFELISEPECVATYSLNVIQPNDLSVFPSFH